MEVHGYGLKSPEGIIGEEGFRDEIRVQHAVPTFGCRFGVPLSVISIRTNRLINYDSL